jgi:hypothetical protein
VTVERALPLIVVVLAGLLLGAELDRGWVPHDEGALGQAAERVLAGQVPHRDFDDIYTGGLAYLHALFFSVGTPASSTLRVSLFVFALPWVAALYAIARRFVPPAGAAIVALTAFVWSVPNYPAAVPSWFNLFCATFGTLALLRGYETGRVYWLALAGMAGGISFLFKLSGVFYLLGAGLALIASSYRPRAGAERDANVDRSGAAIVAAALLAVLVVLAVPLTRAGASEVARFLLPLGGLMAAIAWREWAGGHSSATARVRALLAHLGPFVLGALAPIAVYALFLMATGALSPTIEGVLVKPFRRMESASMHPPPPTALIYAIGLGVLLMPWAKGRIAAGVAILGAAAGGAIVYASGGNPGVYAMGVLAAWGLPVVAAAGAAWLLLTRVSSDDRTRDAAVAVTAIACATLLIEFPFAAPIYLLYTIPLSMVALAAVTGAAGVTPGVLQLVVAGFLLVFGAVRVTPGAVETFGSRFARSDETVRLELERSGLRVRAADAAGYQKLIRFIEPLAKDRTLWAGPDAPEIYFLSGAANHTRTLFDFLDADGGAAPIVDRIHAADATLVVLKLQPDFSRPPDQATVDALTAAFPNGGSAQGFLVFWR